MNRTRVLIAGAAGRDFHNFNLVYRGREEFEVVGFTATQIPNIDGRVYPAELAGELYPDGIPIWPEADLERAIARYAVDEVVFAYSDVTHEHVMHLGSRALAAGASYRLLSPRQTMLTSSKPVVAVCAAREGVDAVLDWIRTHNEDGQIVLAASPVHVEGDATEIAGKRVLAVEDGPTLTHGEMTYGAAVLAAKASGAAELVDPRPFAVGSIAETFEAYPHVGTLLPAMGYGRRQMEELRETIARSDADLVLIGTPIDLRRLIELDKPALRVTYRLQEIGEPTLPEVLAEHGLVRAPTPVAWASSSR